MTGGKTPAVLRLSLRRLAWVLGVVAVLCVVGTTAVALTHDRSSPHTADRLAPAWRRTGAQDAIEYRDGSGRVLVRVTAPWVYGAGVCARRSVTSAFAGLVPRRDRTAAQLAGTWASAISLDVVTGRHLHHTPLAVTGDRVDTDIDVPTGPCNPSREHLTVVTSGDRAVVLVRDLDGHAAALTPSAADRVLATLLP